MVSSLSSQIPHSHEVADGVSATANRLGLSIYFVLIIGSKNKKGSITL
ncbi:Uncharacterised protein [Vibrio cholerae]|nr:Uncharacterised protein [Vibrio cholerae]